MTPTGRFFFWLSSVTLTAALGFKLTNRGAEVKIDPKELLATINKKPVTREEVDKVYPLYRGTMAGAIVIERLVRQALKAKKLPAEGGPPSDGAASPELEVSLRRLVLSEWPDSRLRQFYALYSKELTAYEVVCLQVVVSDKAAVREDLEREVDLESLATRYCVDERGRRHEWQRWYTKLELEEQFGIKMAETLSKFRPGQCTGLVSNSFVLGLRQEYSRYEDLKPQLVRRAVEARRTALLYELLAKARITAGASLGGNLKALEYGL